MWKASLQGCGSLSEKKKWDHLCSRNEPIMLGELLSLTQALASSLCNSAFSPAQRPSKTCLWPCRPCQQGHGHRNLRGRWQLAMLNWAQLQQIQWSLASLTWHRCTMCIYTYINEAPGFGRWIYVEKLSLGKLQIGDHFSAYWNNGQGTVELVCKLLPPH